jgi:hypothetical protein
MKRYFLPKGTVVKHGTSLINAEKILKEGFNQHSLNRHELRGSYERSPEQTGVYVGELIAYFGAYNAYSSEIYSPQFLGNRSFFLKARNYYFDSPKSLRELCLDNVLESLPVILNIELGKDCELFADEDFVFGGNYPKAYKIPQSVLKEEAENSWEKWRSGLIASPIEIDWIKEIEFPSLIKLGSRPSKKMLEDCEFFTLGLRQADKHEKPFPMLEKLNKVRERNALSNKVQASLKGIQKIKNSEGFKSKADRLYNHLAITEAMRKECERYGIRLA